MSLKNKTKPFSLHSHHSMTFFKTWLKFFQEACLNDPITHIFSSDYIPLYRFVCLGTVFLESMWSFLAAQELPKGRARRAPCEYLRLGLLPCLGWGG